MQPNLSQSDRSARMLVGLVLLGLALAIRRLSLPRMVLGLAGVLLLYSSRTGFCHVYKTLGMNTAEQDAEEENAALKGFTQ